MNKPEVVEKYKEILNEGLIDPEELKKYSKITDAQRRVMDTGSFIDEVLDRLLNGTHMQGIKLPFRMFDNVFRLRAEEITILSGQSSAGKSMMAGQIMINAIDQGYKCLSISLEMSPVAQIIRKVRQAALQAVPDMDSVLKYYQWVSGNMKYYSQRGSIDIKTLLSVINYAKDRYDVDFVLVDSLMCCSIASDDWNSQKLVICALANAARDLKTHIMLVCHAKKGDSVNNRLDKWNGVAGSSDLTNRADNVILLGREFEKDGADSYMSVCKARHWDGAEMDVDLKFDMASFNFYMPDEFPKQIGMSEEIRPREGIVGELENMHLNE
jgi:KaiC/GvpD/RAD55 family RecA-like ATPase